MLVSLYLSNEGDSELQKNIPTFVTYFGWPAILMIMGEVTSAYYFQILRKSISENERLLNDSTASCIVSRLSGRINSCSFQASSLLGSNAVGRCIFDAVHLQEQVKFHSFCTEGIDGSLPDPILVTFTTKHSSGNSPVSVFDAKVVQYRLAHSDDVRLLLELTGEVRFMDSRASWEIAYGITTHHAESLHEHGQVECTYTLNRQSSQSDLQHSQIDYSISALSPFNATGDDRIQRLGLCSVETQTDFPSRPPRPPQSTSRASRVNLKSKHLALSKFKEAKRSTVSNMIAEVLLQSNFRGKGCCYWHIGLQYLLEYMFELLARPCNARLHPYSAW